MNLAGMGAAGMDNVTQQIAASAGESSGQSNLPASNAGIISSMASV